MEREQLINLGQALRDIDIALESIDYARVNLPESMKSEKQQLKAMYQKLMKISSKAFDLAHPGWADTAVVVSVDDGGAE